MEEKNYLSFPRGVDVNNNNNNNNNIVVIGG
jgi:hypothetical protein